MAIEEQNAPNSLSLIRAALDVVGGKWKLRVILAVRQGNKRFSEIRKSVEGISPKVLSDELTSLQTDGLIERIVHSEKPVVVEYIITEYGCTLDSVISAFVKWGLAQGFR